MVLPLPFNGHNHPIPKHHPGPPPQLPFEGTAGNRAGKGEPGVEMRGHGGQGDGVPVAAGGKQQCRQGCPPGAPPGEAGDVANPGRGEVSVAWGSGIGVREGALGLVREVGGVKPG